MFFSCAPPLQTPKFVFHPFEKQFAPAENSNETLKGVDKIITDQIEKTNMKHNKIKNIYLSPENGLLCLFYYKTYSIK